MEINRLLYTKMYEEYSVEDVKEMIENLSYIIEEAFNERY